MWPIFYCQVILRLSTDLLRLANRDQYPMHFSPQFAWPKVWRPLVLRFMVHFQLYKYILYQPDNLDKYFVMCRVEENVPDLSYWSQFDCFFTQNWMKYKKIEFYFALEVSFSIYYSFNSNEYNWYTLKGAYFKKQEVGSLILKPFPNRRYS